MSIANNSLIAQFEDIYEHSFKSNQIKIIQCFFDERDVILFAKIEYEKKYDFVLVVCFKNRHHHLVDFFFECFENESK
jgi:hypothetical protein